MGGEEPNSDARGDRSGEEERGRMAAEGRCGRSGAMEQASRGSGSIGSDDAESKPAGVAIG